MTFSITNNFNLMDGSTYVSCISQIWFYGQEMNWEENNFDLLRKKVLNKLKLNVLKY
jgi:hypothetical protein